jgi:DNA-damage-inducible protein J
MSKTQINVRVDADLKAQAELLYKQLGLKMSDVITMLLRQSLYHQGVPFEVKLPSKTTLEAMRELETGGGRRFATPEELFASWQIDTVDA